VINADQTVIIVWNAETKTQHFIRKASFKTEADDFGFLVPTPNQPELAESGNEAFPYLQSITEPEQVKRAQPVSFSCGCASKSVAPPAAKVVNVLEEKLVAGFNAAVLEAESADALVTWLKDNGYAYSPAIAAWAKPYVELGWKITALKVAKEKDAKDQQTVAASALRMSFKTDRPLFPYREPDVKLSGQSLQKNKRLLRIYFLTDARYQGELTEKTPWTGRIAWSNKLSAQERAKTLDLLKLAEGSAPADLWLTEFEDAWPYQAAPADLYFSRDADQSAIKRPPIVQYVSAPWPTDVTIYAVAAVIVVPVLLRRFRCKR
jgi:hypothetical protein